MKKVIQKRAGVVPAVSELSEARLQRVRGGATAIEYGLIAATAMAPTGGAGELQPPK